MLSCATVISERSIKLAEQLTKKSKSKQKSDNQLSDIAAAVCVFSCGIVLFFAIFAQSQLIIAAWIISILALMGVALGYFSVQSRMNDSQNEIWENDYSEDYS